MKIVRVVSELDFGGVEQVLANSVPVLIGKGNVNVTILVLGKGGRVSDSLLAAGVEVKVLERKVRIPNLALIVELRKILRSIKPDVVHCQGAEANFHGILAAAFAGIGKVVGEEIGIPNHHRYWKYIFNWVYKKAHRIIAISEAVKNAVAGLGEAPADKIEILYNPIHSSYFQDLVPKINPSEIESYDGISRRGRLVFISTCRLVPVKNLERLIHVFSDLIKTGSNTHTLELWIVGDGPERANLELLSKKLGVGNVVSFLGFQHDIRKCLLQADVFVLPSLNEGSSVSLAEAMACGLPAVVTKAGGASEILGDNGAGISVNPLDGKEIFYAIETFLKMDPIERKAMGKRAKMEAQRFRPEAYVESLMNLYLE